MEPYINPLKGLELKFLSLYPSSSRERESKPQLPQERKKSPSFSYARTHEVRDKVKDIWVHKIYDAHDIFFELD